MRILIFMIIMLLVFPADAFSGVSSGRIKIHGHAPGYAGEEIIFYTWTDQITFTEAEIFRFNVDANEEFSTEVEIDNGPLYVFSNTGTDYLYMFLDPGDDYRIVLPEKNEKSARENLNPYFEGTPAHIAVLNDDSTSLNSTISQFDILYEPLFGETLIKLTVTRDQHLLDSINDVFNVRFDDNPVGYFNDYRRYKMALFGIMARMQSARNLSDEYFQSGQVLYGNPAYMELFNQVYNKYFEFFSRTPRGSRIFDDINRDKSLDSLRSTLKTDNVLGEERLLEMVILKGLHDAFYGSDFSRASLLVVLDSLAVTTNFPEHAAISGHIRKKVTRLLTGFEPPGFELKDSGGKLTTLSDYRGNYIYLNFCTAASYSCMSEFEVLRRLNENHGSYLKIVTILVDDSYQSMVDFLDMYEYGWDFLYYGDQPTILKDYDIRMFPGYYLLDRDGTLLMSPAPSPAENFESYLLRTMRSRGEIR